MDFTIDKKHRLREMKEICEAIANDASDLSTEKSCEIIYLNEILKPLFSMTVLFESDNLTAGKKNHCLRVFWYFERKSDNIFILFAEHMKLREEKI